MRQKLWSALAASLLAVLLLAGCGQQEKGELIAMPPAVETPELEIEAVEEMVSTEGKAKSYLTGEWIDEEIAGNRPYAIMIGNTSDALPQYGISQADVIYEVPVEGSYTRLMAIFQDLRGVDKIGSIRSCRHYFIYFAQEFDAIYVHFGQALYAEPILARDSVHNISGMDYSVESAFYRDSGRKSPHNVFTTEEGLKNAAETKGYRTTYEDGYKGHYLFAADNVPVELTGGQEALVVSPGYLVNKPWFVYNDEDGLYYRYEFKEEQTDGATEEQLKVKNILVQYCDWRKADDNGYLDIDTMPSGGQGKGKYITNGKVIDITWTKESESSPARYFDESGKEIILNQGKTWVCVIRDTYADRFAVYKTQEELLEARAAE